jgi:guanylate kinase
MMERKPFVLVVSGPSGVGKSTVGDLVLEQVENLDRCISLTTREPRRGDVGGKQYTFVSVEEFVSMRDRGLLLEWAEVHGNLYGTEMGQVERSLSAGRSVLLEIDVQGGMIVKGKIPGAVLVFLVPPSWEELEKRLRERETDEEDVIVKRLENAGAELAGAADYDYIVVNDDIGSCVEQVAGIVASESLKAARTGSLPGPG